MGSHCEVNVNFRRYNAYVVRNKNLFCEAKMHKYNDT